MSNSAKGKKSKKPLKSVESIRSTGKVTAIDDIEVLPPLPGSTDSKSKKNTRTARKGTDSRGVVVYDPLTAYLREMRQFPKLTREEEKELAVRYREEHDLEAAYKLVSSNLWVVVKIAREYEKAARTLLDLIQEGNIGLMEAVKNFDPFRGVRFPSYAVWWVRAYIVRYLIANWRMVKIGTTQAQRKLFFNLNKEMERLEREGFYPGPKLLAEKLDVKESEIIEMQQRLGSPDVSVDAPVKGDVETPLLALLPGSEQTVEDIVAARQETELLKEVLHGFGLTLNKNEKVIFDKRMLAEEKATLQDLSETLSLSKERVRQIEVKIREKLKEYLSERLGDTVIEFMDQD